MLDPRGDDELTTEPKAFPDTEVALADSSINPKKRTVLAWYTEWRKKAYGERSLPSAIEKLSSRQPEFLARDITVEINKDPYAILVLTPIMKRAHSLSCAGEIVFVDSTSCCDDSNHAVTFLLTIGPTGAVPIGAIITSNQAAVAYLAGFELLKKSLGGSGFHGSGSPCCFMTDDSDALRSSLRRTWESPLLFLCHFHICQAVWHWLWTASHNIAKDDRKVLMTEFKTILYAATDESAAANYNVAHQSLTAQRYPQYINYLDNLWSRRVEWCLADRKYPFLRGCNTNNLCEASMRIFKDVILSRCRAYNSVALVEFICGPLEEYFRARLRDFAHSRNPKSDLMLRRVLLKTNYLTAEDISVLGDLKYLVPSAADSMVKYEVDMNLGTCTCVDVCVGQFCKHQAGIYKHFSDLSPSLPSVTTTDRYAAAVLALGPAGAGQRAFYERLHEPHIATETESLVGYAPEAQSIPDVHVDVRDEETATTLLDTIHNTHMALIASHQEDEQVLSGLKKHAQRLKNSAGASLSYVGPRKRISVQPTAKARRKVSYMGSKPLVAGRRAVSKPPHSDSHGRPAKGTVQRVMKRKRALGENVNLNRPNAKSHS